MLGRNMDEHTKTLGTRTLLERCSKEVGGQTEASKATVRRCFGLDGDMLVLRQAASRRCGRAIVDADAGCKMLSPGEWGCTAASMLHEAAGCAVLRSTAAK